jgi:hypothetical protein
MADSPDNRKWLRPIAVPNGCPPLCHLQNELTARLGEEVRVLEVVQSPITTLSVRRSLEPCWGLPLLGHAAKGLHQPVDANEHANPVAFWISVQLSLGRFGHDLIAQRSVFMQLGLPIYPQVLTTLAAEIQYATPGLR